MAINKLTPDALYTACDPARFRFKTTSELPELEGVVGQQRAVDAIQFGIGIRRGGYNLFVLGPERSGKRSIVSRFIEQQAKDEQVPEDWCYVFNFNDPQKPNAISLPAGRANRFARDMAEQVADLDRVVPDALESDEYEARYREIEDAFSNQQEAAFKEMHHEAMEHGLAMLRTPTGFMFSPLNDEGKPIKPEEYKKLSAEKKRKIEQVVEVMKERLEKVVQQIPRWRRETKQKIDELNRDVVMATVGQVFQEMRESYADLPEVLDYLDSVQYDVIEHADSFRRAEENEPNMIAQIFPGLETGRPFLNRYQVNVIVDHSKTTGAPVKYLDHPTYPNLVGRVEHQAQLGALVTDFTMIKSGSMHRANGGYLVIEAIKILTQPYAWEGLKRVLKSGEIKIESLGQALSLISTSALEPEAIPLDIKVVLLGDRTIYYLLSAYDPEFMELFKVAADFDNEFDRTDDNVENFAVLVSHLVRQEQLNELDADAVARMVEVGSRQAEDAGKISSRFGRLADILREADYWARQDKAKIIQRKYIDRAIAEYETRMSRVRDRLIEETLDETLAISTDGERVGQVNGISINLIGEYEFGHPSRITATVHIGKGDVVDIEREIELGGPIHSKGVLILSGFLSGRYCGERPVSLSASLVFEQTYGGVEGDSASSAELFALMSALAEAPIRQGFAVTGSVNQLGEIQAIGGVNDKIEGFYRLCEKRGLSGNQGVIIPKANVRHLMLQREVVEAVEQGKFHIYAIDTVDDGIELLTGVSAGVRDENGKYPEESLNGRIEARLQRMADVAQEHEK